MARIEWTKSALGDLKKLDRIVAKRIIKKISWFGQNFVNIIPEHLGGALKGTYKFRVGDYRIVYSLENDTIVILFVGHRSEIYR